MAYPLCLVCVEPTVGWRPVKFLRNCWYAAAFGHEVADAPFAHTLLGEPAVFYRSTKSTPVAFEDARCHRALPLSTGTVIGDALQCGYHSLTFDPSGACVMVPGQSHIPPGARLRARRSRSR